MSLDNLVGLPAHPLIVHAAVVLLPIAAIATVAVAVVPRWRRPYAPLALAASLVAAGTIWLAMESGESLEERVTETALIDEDARSNLIERVAPLGVQIAIDDFGTGYSSLSYLQQLPVTAVKLDRSFVAQVGDEGVRAVVRSVSAISAVMGYGTIAEGIETEAEATDLASLNYGFAQGFHYSRPVEAQLIAELLAEQKRLEVTA